jgi:hypothetical protein
MSDRFGRFVSLSNPVSSFRALGREQTQLLKTARGGEIQLITILYAHRALERSVW